MKDIEGLWVTVPHAPPGLSVALILTYTRLSFT